MADEGNSSLSPKAMISRTLQPVSARTRAELVLRPQSGTSSSRPLAWSVHSKASRLPAEGARRECL